MGLVSYSLDFEKRDSSEMTTTFHWDEASETMIHSYSQDVEKILESNREKQRLDDGYTSDRSMRRVARIPMILVEKILREKGWNPMDQNNSELVLQLLDDPEYAYLKTSHGRHSHSNARSYYRGSTSTKPVYAGDDDD